MKLSEMMQDPPEEMAAVLDEIEMDLARIDTDIEALKEQQSANTSAMAAQDDPERIKKAFEEFREPLIRATRQQTLKEIDTIAEWAGLKPEAAKIAEAIEAYRKDPEHPPEQIAAGLDLGGLLLIR